MGKSCGTDRVDGRTGGRCPVTAPDPGCIDRLVGGVSAFRTWADLRRAMAGGYVPTIPPTGRLNRRLARVCRAAGFEVNDGRTVA